MMSDASAQNLDLGRSSLRKLWTVSRQAHSGNIPIGAGLGQGAPTSLFKRRVMFPP